jgi:hypothetical protein
MIDIITVTLGILIVLGVSAFASLVAIALVSINKGNES